MREEPEPELVQIALLDNPDEANLLVGRLRADGLRAGLLPIGLLASGFVRFAVLVHAEDAAEAEELAAMDHSALLAAEFPGTTPGCLTCERCQSASVVTHELGGLLTGLSRLFGIVPPVRHRCMTCGFRW